MNYEIIGLTKLISESTAVFFILLAAIFTYLDVAQNDKYDTVKSTFASIWIKIGNSKWFKLPEYTILFFLKYRDLYIACVDRYNVVVKYKMKGLIKFILLLQVALVLFCLFKYHIGSILLNNLIAIIFLPFAIIAAIFFCQDLYLSENKKINRNFMQRLMSGIVINYVFFMLLSIVTLSFITTPIIISYKFCTSHGLVADVLFVAFFIFIYFIVLSSLVHEITDIFLFITGAVLSIVITSFCSSMGNTFTNSAITILPVQFFISNAIFDGLTVVGTFFLLNWAIKKDTLLRIPIAIIADLILAALFAVCSLYFAVIFTDKALLFKEVLNVLLAKSPGGTKYEFGTYFWFMHSTFTPITICLCLVFIAWLCKLLTIPIYSYFGKAAAHNRPLLLTTALCGIFVAFFAGIAKFLNTFETIIKH